MAARVTDDDPFADFANSGPVERGAVSSSTEPGIDLEALLQMDDVIEIDGRKLTIRNNPGKELRLADVHDLDALLVAMDQCSALLDYYRTLSGAATRDLELVELCYEEWMAHAAAEARISLKAERTSGVPTDKAVKERVIETQTVTYLRWQRQMIKLRERVNRYESAARAADKRCMTLPSVAKMALTILERPDGVRLMHGASETADRLRPRVGRLE